MRVQSLSERNPLGSSWMSSTIANSSNAIGTYSHHMPSNGGSAGRPAGSGSPTGRMPQDRARVPKPGFGVDGDFLAVDDDPTAPAAQLGESLRVERHPVTRTQNVRLFLDDIEQPFPGEIGGDAFGFVEDQAPFVQRLLDLDPVAVVGLVEPVLVDRVGEMHRGLGVAAPDEHERVLDSEVGVVADAADDKNVAGAVVGVEVGAVVEVAVRGPRQ